MLEYGDVFLEQNDEALKQLEELMTSAGFEVALEMAPDDDTDAFEPESLVAA